jgi:hypothetical protein
MNPYDDIGRDESRSTWKRIFSHDSPDSVLIWHRDKRDREISVIEGTGWQLQLDNQLPEYLWVGKSYTIPAMTYHRVIKGRNDLHLFIREL